ncbi:DUF4386 domain-containing protein [Corallincola luteus]|uniref:DUF4386 domain-containing protein n=1 Tax=Corallincola luteus TaxID=1775177 RepID=A0ABY2AQK1_9GAMM|nr:DUF4386 domain-containing protein [Corallincola luteus]TCI05297.1 DUF4386 domain-containing protein [Corallincola luteus]
MDSRQGRYRWIGGLILAQLICGILVNFFLTAPLFGTPGFLVNGAQHSQQIGFAVLVGLVTGMLTLAVAITLYPLAKPQWPTLTRWFVVLSVISFTVSVMENISLMSLVSYSEAYTTASPEQQPLYELFKTVVASTRNWTHYIGLMLSGTMLLFLYLLLFRSRMIPRLLAVFGMLAVSAQLVAVAMPLFGLAIVFALIAPLALSQLMLALWILMKGLTLKAANQPSLC